MAKKPKAIVPFFKLRGDIADSLEALGMELMLTIQTIDTLLELGTIDKVTRESLTLRLAALKAVTMSEPD